MALNFPLNPTVGQTYQTGSSATYRFQGDFWYVEEPSTSVFVTAATASFASFASTAASATSASIATQVRTTTGTSDTTTWVPLVGNNINGGQSLLLDNELAYNAQTNVMVTNISGFSSTATSASFATTAATATQVRTTSGTTDTTTWIPLVGNNTTGAQPLILDGDLAYNAATNVLSTSISGNAATATTATTATSATQRTTAPHYIGARNSTSRTSFGAGSDVVFDVIDYSNGISMIGGVGINLTGGKVYLINVSLSGDTFSNTTGGFATFRLTDSSGTALLTQTAVLVPVTSVAPAYTSPVLNLIYAPVSNITVKIRCIAATGTFSLREDMTHIAITEII